MRVLVTGASGFVGTALCEDLSKRGYVVRAALRDSANLPAPTATEVCSIGDIGPATDWREALQGVDIVVHAAARAHVLGDAPENAKLYFEVNALGTQALARAAAAGGVRGFIFVSSVKVNGERSGTRLFTSDDDARPHDAYALSKWLAELSLQQLAREGAMQVQIVRPPLVYGPQVRANFLRLLRLVDAGIPLPLGAVDNRRSLISIWNLCDFLACLIQRLPASGSVWLPADGAAISTPELLRSMALAMGKRARVLNVPVGLLKRGGALLGKGAELDRLCDSLAVDVGATCQTLAWHPPLSLQESMSRTVQWYRSSLT